MIGVYKAERRRRALLALQFVSGVCSVRFNCWRRTAVDRFSVIYSHMLNYKYILQFIAVNTPCLLCFVKDVEDLFVCGKLNVFFCHFKRLMFNC